MQFVRKLIQLYRTAVENFTFIHTYRYIYIKNLSPDRSQQWEQAQISTCPIFFSIIITS